jgi:hypothetical protein
MVVIDVDTADFFKLLQSKLLDRLEIVRAALLSSPINMSNVIGCVVMGISQFSGPSAVVWGAAVDSAAVGAAVAAADAPVLQSAVWSFLFAHSRPKQNNQHQKADDALSTDAFHTLHL